jgi:hypothetical protein
VTAQTNGQTVTIGHAKIYLDLRDIRTFYEAYTVGEVPMQLSSPPTLLPTSQMYDPNDTYFSDNHYLLYVHGWNMSNDDKDAYANCAYKRLWWNGYRGKFGTFRWPTRNGFTAFYSPLSQPQNYDDSEYIAWQSGVIFGQWLPNLSSHAKCPIDNCPQHGQYSCWQRLVEHLVPVIC